MPRPRLTNWIDQDYNALDMATSIEFRSTLHEAARAWAEAGFSVFPCTPNLKTPATANGLHDATTNLEQIDAWWASNSSFNIGVSPGRSAMYVLDVDPPLGAESLASLCKDHGPMPDTLTIHTPRGGLHYWFTGSCPSTVSKLGPKLDTRGEGGYVLVPPSIVNGKEYTYETDVDDIAPGPGWINQALADGSREGVGAADVDLDQPANISRAITLLRGYCESGHVAVSGSGGDNRTYAVAAEVLNLGLTPEKAFELLADHWNPSCIPPWERDELMTKVRNATEYAQNEPGAWAVGAAAEVFSGLAKFGDQNAPATKHSKFYPRNETEQDARPEPTWLIPNLLPDEAITMIYGPSGSWKSFLALDLCLTLSSGIARFGAPARDPVDTVYVAAEGARAIERWRRPAWREANHVAGPLPFYAVDCMPLIARPQEVIELLEAIKARNIHPKLIVIDTVARAMTGKNENDARDAGEFVEAMDFLKRELRSTVLAIHHTGKDEERGGRGSSALYADFDTVMEVKANKLVRALALYMRKQKDADEPQVPWTFEGHEVGQSLAFFEIATTAFNKLVKGEDAFGPAKIGAALRELGAIGETRAVTTLVLAMHITPQIQGETTEEQGRAYARSSRQLQALAKTRLEAYTIGQGRTLKWTLPPEALDPEF